MMRSVLTPAANRGIPCPPAESNVQVVPCNTQVCPTNAPVPVDCVVSDYVASGQCSAMCGGGVQQMVRTIVTAAANGGKACPAVSTNMISQPCNRQLCPTTAPTLAPPVHCVMSDFKVSGACSAECGGGVQTSVRTVLRSSSNGGQPCPDMTTNMQTVSCNTQPCTTATSVDCVMSAFQPVGVCSVTCGGGWQQSVRTIVSSAANGGKPCPSMADNLRNDACNTHACPTVAPTTGPTTPPPTRPPMVDCVMSGFSAVGSCSAACGGGSQLFINTVAMPAANGGQACPPASQNIRTEACNTQACPTVAPTQPPLTPVDCVMSPYSPMGDCSVTCGTGVQQMVRSVVTPAANGGKVCPDIATNIMSQTCNTQACPTLAPTTPPTTPVDCVMSDFQLTGACSVACGAGVQSLVRSVVTPAANRGKACPDAATNVVSQACNTQACPDRKSVV